MTNEIAPNEELAQKERLTIDEAAQLADVRPQYIRTLLRKGELESVQEPIEEGSQVWRHEILMESFVDWNENRTRSRRADGRNKFTVYATPDEAEAIEDALEEAGLTEVEFERAYKPKKK
jgi:hypothetical protein